MWFYVNAVIIWRKSNMSENIFDKTEAQLKELEKEVEKKQKEFLFL